MSAKTPGLDPAIKAAIRQAAVSGSSVTLRARQHEDLIRAVGRHAVVLASNADGQPAKAYGMLEAILDALAPDSVRREWERAAIRHVVDPMRYTEY
jgi:hypothetical protein